MLAALAALFVAPAQAQSPSLCGDRGRIVTHLETTYGETLSATGLDAVGRLVELFVSPERTWTVLVTRPGGPTCVASAGEAWGPAPPKPGKTHF